MGPGSSSHPQPAFPVVAAPVTPVTPNGVTGGDCVTGAAGGRRDPDDDVSPPRTKRDALRWLGLALMGFVVGQVASALLLTVVAAFTGHLSDVSQLASRSVPPPWVVVSGLVGLWIGFVGAVVFASRAYGTGSVVRDMRLRFEWIDVPIGIVTGLFGQFVLLYLLYLPLEHIVPHLSTRLNQSARHLTGGFPGADLVVIGVLTVGVVPFVEELMFRGLILRGFVRLFKGAGPALGPALATVSTGIVFGLAHLELLELLGLAAFGIVLSVLAYRLGRLGPGIIAHATFNLIAIVAISLPGGVLR